MRVGAYRSAKGESPEDWIKKKCFAFSPGHFDTPPPRWGLLSDRGIIKKVFFGFGCWRSFMDYWMLVFVNIKLFSDRFYHSGKYWIRSPERPSMLSFLGRWVVPTQSVFVINSIMRGWGRIEAPGGEFVEWNFKKKCFAFSPGASIRPHQGGVYSATGGL